jgi:hypothetical protein
MRHIDILYANHWPEVVSLLAERVRPGDALVTEDAPSPEFAQMLAGDLPIDDYLMLTDIEFPEFGRRMCRLWQRLHQADVAVIQVEPFRTATRCSQKSEGKPAPEHDRPWRFI